MAGCDDTRQLTEAQRQAGYQSQRTGVPRAIRPFTGRPTLDNLIDYINRELQPAVRQTRDAVNDVYLQVADNAPSGNPLAYYFSTETAAADPTTGRIRLNASPQDTATVIRISQTNARLVDVAPWLDVMAGSSTAPLGVVTLSDAINPGRSIRFDLSTMVDQGDYWDLGVSVIESTHDDPFVDGEAVVLAFIPGVASVGTTVPPGALTPIGANTVIGNPTAATAAPVAIALNDYSVLGRAGVAGTGNIEAITVPGTGTLTGESVFLQSSSLRNHVRWSNWTLGAMPLMADNRFVGNVSGATARPAYLDFSELDSVSVTYENVTKSFIRSALSGDVTALQNDNTVTINVNAVTDTKLRDSGPLSVIGRAANTTGDPADISAVAASGAVLRESGSAIGWGTVANAGLANMAAATVKGRALGAGTGAPTDLTATQTNAIVGSADLTLSNAFILGTQQNYSSTLPAAITLNDNANRLYILVTGDGDIQTITPASGTTTAGRLVMLYIVGSGTKTIKNAFSGGGVGRIQCPNNVDLLLTNRDAVLLVGDGSNGWLAMCDNGQIPTASIVDAAITNAKLANMVAGRVKGRQIDAGTGVPVDLTGAEQGENYRADTRQTVAATGTMDIALNDDTTILVLQLSADTALRSLNNTAGGDGRLVRIEHDSGSAFTLTIGHNLATPTYFPFYNSTERAIQLRRGGTINVRSRSGFWRPEYPSASIAVRKNSTGTLFDRGQLNLIEGTGVTLTVADDSVANEVDVTVTSVLGADGDKGDLTVSGTGTVWTIDNDVVTNAKAANMAAATVKGRAIGAGTGDPTDLSQTQLSDLFRVMTAVDETGAPGTYNNYVVAEATKLLRINPNGAGDFIITGIALGSSNSGGWLRVFKQGGGGTDRIVFKHADAGSTAGNQFILPNDTDFILDRTNDAVDLQYIGGRWQVMARVVNTTGLQDNAVTDAKLRQSAALSVIGRSANSTGNVADISASAASGAVLRESGSAIGWGTIATAGIGNNQVTDGKFRQSGACSVVGRTANTTGDVADISATANDRVLTRASDTVAFRQVSNDMIADGTIALGKVAGIGANTVLGNNTGSTTNPVAISVGTNTVLGRAGSNIVAQQVATAQIADDAVTDAKLRNGTALSVIGRSANSSGDVGDIAAANDGEVLRRSGTALGFGTVATTGIAAAAVTNAKLANMVQATIKGRAESAGTGDPQDLTSSDVVSIIDGAPVTWLNAQEFTHRFVLSGVGTSGATAANDLGIGNSNVMRFTGPVDPLTGMVPAADGHVVLLVNAHDSVNMGIHLGSASSSVANRFGGLGTSRVIRPGEMALAWYDGATGRWALLCRDDSDL